MDRKVYFITFGLMLLFICQLSYSQKRYSVFSENGFVGLKNGDGRIVIKPNKYTEIRELNDNQGIAYLKDSLLVAKIGRDIGFVDIEGNTIIEAVYNNIFINKSETLGYYFSLHGKGNTRGLSTIKGRILVPALYKSVWINEYKAAGIPWIKVVNKINEDVFEGVYDLNGHEIISPNAYKKVLVKSVPMIGGGLYIFISAKAGDKACLFDLNGETLYPPTEYANLDIFASDKSSNGLEIAAWNDDFFSSVRYELYTNKILEDNRNEGKRMTLIANADDMFNKKKYKAAAENYTKALAIKEKDYVYYNRGLCYYNINKYDKAIADFKKSILLNTAKDLINDANEMIESSEMLLQNKKERHESFINNIIGFTLGVASAAVMIENNRSASLNNYSSRTFNDNYGGYDSSSKNITSNGSSSQRCGVCSGKGSTVEYTSNYGVSSKKYCSECRKDVVESHYHKTCIVCGGKGYK